MEGTVKVFIGVIAVAVLGYLAYQAFTSMGAQNYVNATQELAKAQGAFGWSQIPSIVASGTPSSEYNYFPDQTTIPQSSALIPLIPLVGANG